MSVKESVAPDSVKFLRVEGENPVKDICTYQVIRKDVLIREEAEEDEIGLEGIIRYDKKIVPFKTRPPKRKAYIMKSSPEIKVLDSIYDGDMLFVGVVRNIRKDGYMEVVSMPFWTWYVRERKVANKID